MAKKATSEYAQSEALSADEEKQMNDLRATDAEDNESGNESPTDSSKSADATGAAPQKPQEQSIDENKMVPHKALHEEREGHKSTKAELAKLREDNIRLTERFKMLEPLLNQQQPKPEEKKLELIDPEKDPLGALKQMQNMTADEREAIKTFRQQEENKAKFSRDVNELQAYTAPIEAEFVKQNPDYVAASDFLRNSRFQELTFLGKTPQEAQAIIAMETIQIADFARKNGKSAPEMAYNMAKMRGYVKAADGANGANNGAKPSTETEKLLNIAKGQAANKSLGNNASATEPGTIDGKAFANMSDEDFMATLGKMSKARQREIFGD